MKVYWAEGRGAIITSANLSTNALGSGDLKEVGVLLSDEDIDIDHLISSLKLRNPSKKELSDLDRLHDLFYVKNPPVNKKRQVPTLETWYQSIAPRLWKLGWANTPSSLLLDQQRKLQNKITVFLPTGLLPAKRMILKRRLGSNFYAPK